MKRIGWVSGEGGPLLLGDHVSIRSWSGIETSDYATACASFDVSEAEGIELVVDGHRCIAWKMRGGGTSAVFRISREELLIVPAWLHDPENDGAFEEFARQAPSASAVFGHLFVQSGGLAILWAPESGAGLRDIEPGVDTAPEEGFSMSGTALVVSIEKGEYEAAHDEVRSGAGNARRCRLRLVRPA